MHTQTPWTHKEHEDCDTCKKYVTIQKYATHTQTVWPHTNTGLWPYKSNVTHTQTVWPHTNTLTIQKYVTHTQRALLHTNTLTIQKYVTHTQSVTTHKCCDHTKIWHIHKQCDHTNTVTIQKQCNLKETLGHTHCKHCVRTQAHDIHYKHDVHRSKRKQSKLQHAQTSHPIPLVQTKGTSKKWINKIRTLKFKKGLSLLAFRHPCHHCHCHCERPGNASEHQGTHLQGLHSPNVQSNASTSVCTLKPPNTGSNTIIWMRRNTAHTDRNG